MSQIVQLKRSALSGKVPGTGSLNLGELALNTYDGKIFFRRSGSTDTIQEVVTTNSTVTGSIRLEGTGSFGSLKVNDTLTINHGEAIISGSALVTSDLTILGAVNARQFNISVISSSVLFQSGSTRFGNTSDDTHDFTGSINVTGSLYLNGVDLSQGNNSGSFSGSFQGDGSGLRGVVSDDIPRDGWDYQANSSASISDFNAESDKYHIDFAQSQSTEVGTPVGYKGFLTNVSGSTQILPTLDGIDFVVGNNVVASIGVNGIVAQATAGTVSGSSQLTSSYDSRYVLSGSISAVPTGTISGSSQLTASVLATTGSNTFRGTQTLSGSIIPAIDNTYDLGSATYQWRDIYVSSGSLYIDGTKVLGSTGNELQITTDVGQSIKILEAGSDSIILQSADGNIELKSSGGGNLLFDPTTGLIDVRGTLQIQDGNKITSSGGLGIVFGNNIVVSGSIESTGTINGINLSTFSSSVASTLLNQNTATSSYETKGRGIVSGSSQITYANISSIPSGIVSSSAQILNASGLVSGSSQITYADISSIPSGIVSGSSQITISSTTGFTTYSSSVDSRITTEKGRVDAILLAADADKDSFAEIVTLINSVDTSNDSTFASFYTASVGRLNNLETTSGSVNISISNINTQTGSSNTRLTALETSASTALSTNGTQATSITNLNTTTASLNTSVTNLNTTTASLNTSVSNLNTATSSYETKGRSIVSGSSQITFSGISSLPTLVSGSSQVTLSSTTGYGSVLNQAVLTTSSPTFVSGTFGSNLTIQSGSILNIYRTDNTRALQLYTTVNECVINSWEATSEPLHIRSFGSGGRIQFFTSGSEHVRITPLGSIGMGTTIPSGKVGIKASGADGLIMESDSSSVNNSSRLFFSSSVQTFAVFNNSADLRFTYDAIPGNTSGTSLARFTNTGKYFRMEAGTGGIQFGGDTSADNALDDYEEGTWTPTFAGAGTPSHTTQFGRYTKIGNIVHCTIAIRATSISGGSTIQISGLPFSAGDASDTGQRATYAPRLGGHINGVTETTARFRVAGNYMDGVKGDGDTTYMTAAQFCSGGSVQITGNFWYYA